MEEHSFSFIFLNECNDSQILIPTLLLTDLGSNNSGYYTLQAVLTHKGRSSTSGHYVAWVRQTGEKWVMCDDDNMVPVTTEDILKLSGGGKKNVYSSTLNLKFTSR